MVLKTMTVLRNSRTYFIKKPVANSKNVIREVLCEIANWDKPYSIGLAESIMLQNLSIMPFDISLIFLLIMLVFMLSGYALC